MVKIFNETSTFQHPWSVVTTAFWRKYPNKYALHVQSVDTFDRKVDDQGNLVTNRIISFKNNLPSWMPSYLAQGMSHVYTVETSVVNPSKEEMVVKSVNITGSSLVTCEETLTYSTHPTEKNTTVYKQEAVIKAFMPMLSSRFENHSFQNLCKKSKEGIEVIENISSTIKEEGVMCLLNKLAKAVSHENNQS